MMLPVPRPVIYNLHSAKLAFVCKQYNVHFIKNNRFVFVIINRTEDRIVQILMFMSISRSTETTFVETAEWSFLNTYSKKSISETNVNKKMSVFVSN
jgi:hypothetical protein